VRTPLDLILHEVATNAAKNGALSVESGRVRISW
jgi:two-component sensor histidine kinase